MSAGKQRKLTAWLGAIATESSLKLTASAPADSNSQSMPAISSQAIDPSHAVTDISACLEPTRANSIAGATGSDSAAASTRPLPSSLTRKGSGARAASGGKQGGKAGQTSLRSFMQRPAAAIANAVTAPNAAMQSTTSALSGGHSAPACAGLLGAAPTASSDPQGHMTTMTQSDAGALPGSSGAQISAQLPVQDHSGLSSLYTLSQMHGHVEQPGATMQPALGRGQKRSHSLTEDVAIEQTAGFPAAHQQAAVEAGYDASQSDVPRSQSSMNAASDAGKAAVTAAWSKIHSKMKAPKCRGHNEDCVIREVKKNGPNKGDKHRSKLFCKPSGG